MNGIIKGVILDMKDIVERFDLISKRDPNIRKLADSFNSKRTASGRDWTNKWKRRDTKLGDRCEVPERLMSLRKLPIRRTRLGKERAT